MVKITAEYAEKGRSQGAGKDDTEAVVAVVEDKEKENGEVRHKEEKDKEGEDREGNDTKK